MRHRTLIGYSWLSVTLLCVGLLGCHPGRLLEVRPWLRSNPSDFDLLENAPPERHLTYALAYETQGEFKQSLQHYRIACQDESLLSQARLGMARVSFLRGQSRKALSWAREAMDLDGSLSSDLNDFLWAQATLDNTPRASVDLARLAVENSQEHRAGCLDTLAFIYIQRGKLVEAEKSLDQAQQAISQDMAKEIPALQAWILFHRAVIAERKGNASAQQEFLAKAEKWAEIAQIRLRP